MGGQQPYSPSITAQTPSNFYSMYLTLAAKPPAVQSLLPIEQSGPIQLGSQLHSPVSGMKAPWPWHWSGHWALGSSQWSPPQPGLQWHSPFTQMPLLEHVGSRQSTALNGRNTNMKKNTWTQENVTSQLRVETNEIMMSW